MDQPVNSAHIHTHGDTDTLKYVYAHHKHMCMNTQKHACSSKASKIAWKWSVVPRNSAAFLRA